LEDDVAIDVTDILRVVSSFSGKLKGLKAHFLNLVSYSLEKGTIG